MIRAMDSWKRLFAVFAIVFSASSSAHAAITVDGNLSDWGIAPATYLPASGIHSTVEDWTGTPPNGYLVPGYGGQAYDAEAMYATFEGSYLFIALITGHDPNTLQNPSANSYGAGDFAIDFGKDGHFELGINFNHRLGNATYESLTQGGVYWNPTWRYGLWAADGSYNPANPDPAHPTAIDSSNPGTLLGIASFAYTTYGVTGYGSNPSHGHYFYEIGVPKSLLFSAGWDGQTAFNIHWTMLCANDSIIVDPPAPVPEPGALSLVAFALLVLLSISHRRRANP